MQLSHFRSSFAFVFSLSALLAGCSESDDTPAQTSPTTSLELLDVSLPNLATWPLNMPLTFSFSEPVDFSTVSGNTLSIVSEFGEPAVGSFTPGRQADGTPDATVVVFRPSCPMLADLSDGGLAPDETIYVVTVVGLNESDNVVRSVDGGAITASTQRVYFTPPGIDPALVLVDTLAGPPQPLLRSVGDSREDTSYFELGNGERLFLEFDEASATYQLSDPSALLPLNLYSDPDSSLAAVLVFDQAVDPGELNLSTERLSFEVLDGTVWRPLSSTVELLENCTEIGARVRLTPEGILPESTGVRGPNLRVVVRAGFRDLLGQANLTTIDDFARARTEERSFDSLTPPDVLADEVFEDFLLSAEDLGSVLDPMAPIDAQPAVWGDGHLEAASGFEGTGGPNGDFDWILGSSDPKAAADSSFFDTGGQTIFGGPQGAPTNEQVIDDGILEVRNLTIEPNFSLQVVGPNPLVIRATGDVIIRGTLSVDGANAPNVGPSQFAEGASPGGVGRAGGGRGGDASSVLDGSTPMGSAGFGPFDAPGLGGQGGESQFAPAPLGKNARRPGGGGGGAHSNVSLGGEESYPWPSVTGANDIITLLEDPNQGLVARRGLAGTMGGIGAVSGLTAASGGLPGPTAFLDADQGNDFFGVGYSALTNRLVIGEASEPIPGSGGGGGGDAIVSDVFPHPLWDEFSEEMGAGGGGGAGVVRIRALGRIIVTGAITANGGSGGVGENVIFLDHVGGGGGGGSGGHVILETAAKVYLGVEPEDLDPGFGDDSARNVLVAEGARSNFGNFDSEVAVTHSIGGQGGAGLIQIHVPDYRAGASTDEELADVVVAPGSGSSLAAMTRPAARIFPPTLGSRSAAQSRWIALGGLEDLPGSMLSRSPTFLFGGIQSGADADELEPDEGRVLTEPTIYSALIKRPALEPILGRDAPLPVGGGLVVGAGPWTFELSTPALGELLADDGELDLFLRNPALLTRFPVELIQNEGSPNETTYSYVVSAASYDDVVGRLTLEVTGGITSPEAVAADPATATLGLRVRPKFFEVSYQGVPGYLRASSSVSIQFQATGVDASGAPDETTLLQDWTGDVSLLGAQDPGELRYVRFRVAFDLDALDEGIVDDVLPTRLEWFRLPFRF